MAASAGEQRRRGSRNRSIAPAMNASSVPATMTVAGLHFLQALAGQARDGCFLEIGPLFGSSTRAIDAGRRTNAPIHTIDTFEPAPWVVRRLGRDLSRSAFDEFTGDIPRLVVHEGFAPDVVRDSWREPIGFFFDDATHGDPGWSANFDFFSQYFTDDAIVCGDDFAGGWPDIPRNVTRIADDWGVGLYVIGRVWAITRVDERRIVAAANECYPGLVGAFVEASFGTGSDTKPAVCWSRGLHGREPLRWFRYGGDPVASVRFTTYAAGGSILGEWGPGDRVELDGVAAILMSGPGRVRVQYCLADDKMTANSTTFRHGERFEVPKGAHVVAVRLTTRRPG